MSNRNLSKVKNIMRANKLTLSDLTTMTEHDFLKYRFVGKSALEEAKKLLAENGLSFKEEFMDHSEPTSIRPIEIEVIEIAGFAAALSALRLPYSLPMRSFCDAHYATIGSSININTNVTICEDDMNLMKSLIKGGDEKAKVIRGINVWLKINAPLYWWNELETYYSGRTRLSSESTMHTDCKGLTGEELQRAKASIPSGKRLTKVDMFSYQTLRRICNQRANHRLPEWHQFIDMVKTLPFAKELIFAE